MINFQEKREVQLSFAVRSELNAWLDHVEAECGDLDNLLATHLRTAGNDPELCTTKARDRKARLLNAEQQGRRATAELRRACRHIRKLLELAPDPLWIA